MNAVILIIIGIPLIEIYLMIKVGGIIGALSTISLIFLTAITGIYFAKLEDMGYSYSDEIVTKATITEGENAENLVPEIRKMQAKKEEVAKKEVRVSSVINTKQETVQKEKELTPNDVKDSKSISNQDPFFQSNAELVLVSVDGSFTLKSSVSGFDVYEGSTKIGTATKTSAGSYLVSTSEFTGVGFYDNNQFTVEREIKGVSGLVKMIFTEK